VARLNSISPSHNRGSRGSANNFRDLGSTFGLHVNRHAKRIPFRGDRHPIGTARAVPRINRSRSAVHALPSLRWPIATDRACLASDQSSAAAAPGQRVHIGLEAEVGCWSWRTGQVDQAICRELGVSRTVVRKVIRSGATEFRYSEKSMARTAATMPFVDAPGDGPRNTPPPRPRSTFR
jgi:hypothetical protein